MIPSQSVNISQLPCGTTVNELRFVKPHVSLPYPGLRMLLCNFGEIVGRFARSDVVYVCPIMEKKKKKDNGHERNFTIVV